MSDLPELPPHAFDKLDPERDDAFYEQPRFVTHIDDTAIATVTQIYRDRLPAGGVILDMMSSWVSHLPPEMQFDEVIGHGMNAEELAANPRLSRWFVQDLNAEPDLKLANAAVDAACICVSVQYLQHPFDVFRSVARVLRPGGTMIVTFSNRCFPTKAVAIWQALSGTDQQRLVVLYMQRAGFSPVETGHVRQIGGDPIWAVIGTRPADVGISPAGQAGASSSG